MSRVIRLQVEGFKRLVAVDITPDPHLVRVGGNNEEGKTSVLDAIFAAIGGADAAPIKPVRTGEEYAIIKLDMGDLKVTRYFDELGDKLLVQNADGATYSAGQSKLDDMVGSITFDPLAFAGMGDREQVAELLRLVPLEVDLDKLKAADKADYAERRDVNRDAAGIKTRFEAIPVDPDLPEERPDRAAILAELEAAGDKNTARAREEDRRQDRDDEGEAALAESRLYRNQAADLRKRAEELDGKQKEAEERSAAIKAELAALPALPEGVDTSEVRARLAEAEALGERFDKAIMRENLAAEFATLKAKSDALTLAMTNRAEARAKALAAAPMPIEGLSLATIEDDLRVTFNGEPFSQSSGAQRIRVSTALAIAANPKLKVCRIKDGSLLDAKNLAVLADMAKEHDFQIWLEVVGEDGEGIIMEAGKVKGAADPEKLEPPKRRKKGDGTIEVESGEELKAGDAVKLDAAGKAVKAGAPAKPRPGAMSELVTKPAGQLDL